jgi:hypothetical protein
VSCSSVLVLVGKGVLEFAGSVRTSLAISAAVSWSNRGKLEFLLSVTACSLAAFILAAGNGILQGGILLCCPKNVKIVGWNDLPHKEFYSLSEYGLENPQCLKNLRRQSISNTIYSYMYFVSLK